MRRIAAFLGLELSEERLAEIVAATSFTTMKRNAAAILGPQLDQVVLAGGAQRFIHRGSNGRCGTC
ncbi:MAG: sulfotransferase domain-containing protein [Actinobacteria bacterium]|nr:sulfotransferase domain-containing protein [Actinomycetota bacterium]